MVFRPRRGGMPERSRRNGRSAPQTIPPLMVRCVDCRRRLLLLEDPLQAKPRGGEAVFPGFFLLLYGVHEIAAPAVRELLGVGPLDLAAAERTCNDPAGPARVLSIVGAVQVLMHRNRADPEVLGLVPAGLTSAIFELPAIRFPHHSGSFSRHGFGAVLVAGVRPVRWSSLPPAAQGRALLFGPRR